MDNPDGYNRLAQALCDHPDLSIFRRFEWLDNRNLLIQQAELIHLEAQLKSIIDKNRESRDLEKESFEFNLQLLKGPHQTFENGEQWVKELEIRQALKIYKETLLQSSQLLDRPPANERSLSVLRKWLEHEDGGHNFLRHREAEAWSKDFEKDLISLTTRYDSQDTLSKYIECSIIPWFHKRSRGKTQDATNLAEMGIASSSSTTTSSPPPPSPLFDYGDSVITTAFGVFTTILSCLLPTIPVFALSCIQSPLARMGATVAFTILFITVFVSISKATRVECFMASTAFVALQMVFEGSANGT